MGSSPPAQTSQNVQTQNVLDPQLKTQILQNIDFTKLLSSGMLPKFTGGAGGAAPGTPSTPPTYGGGLTIDQNGNPVYDAAPNFTAGAAGGSVNPGDYTNPNGTPYTPPTSFTAGFDPSQLLAQQGLTGLATNSYFDPNTFGADVFNKFKNYTAPTVAAPAGYTPQTFGDLDFSKYMMPGENAVIDPLKAYFAQAGDRAVASDASRGAMGSAVRGSNNDLRESLIRGETNLQGGTAISGAMQNLYGISANLANSDLTRGATAQGAKYTGDLQAAMANAGFKAAEPGVQMDAAGRSGQATGQAFDANKARLALLDTIGANNRQLTQDRMDDPLKALSLLTSTTNQVAPTFTGASSHSTATSPYSGASPIVSGLAGAAGAYGLAGAAGLTGSAATATAAATAASPWLWPLVIGAGLVGAIH